MNAFYAFLIVVIVICIERMYSSIRKVIDRRAGRTGFQTLYNVGHDEDDDLLDFDDGDIELATSNNNVTNSPSDKKVHFEIDQDSDSDNDENEVLYD